MNLDDASQSGTLFSRLGELAQRFIAGHASEQEAPIPAWLDGFPSCLSELHQILTRWNGAVAAFSGGFGEQDSLFLPPRRLPTGHFLLVRENQGGFELRIAEQGGNWVARRFENSDITPVDSLDGYLVSFALQEMVMSAPLWAIEESMNGIPAAMTPDEI